MRDLFREPIAIHSCKLKPQNFAVHMQSKQTAFQSALLETI